MHSGQMIKLPKPELKPCNQLRIGIRLAQVTAGNRELFAPEVPWTLAPKLFIGLHRYGFALFKGWQAYDHVPGIKRQCPGSENPEQFDSLADNLTYSPGCCRYSFYQKSWIDFGNWMRILSWPLEKEVVVVLVWELLKKKQQNSFVRLTMNRC